jgi:hypothetical protein
MRNSCGAESRGASDYANSNLKRNGLTETSAGGGKSGWIEHLTIARIFPDYVQHDSTTQQMKNST